MDEKSPIAQLRHLLAKTVILCLPLLAWQLCELFVLPIHAWTFRAWEALANEHFGFGSRLQLLPGRFYPNTQTTMMSRGNMDRSAHPEMWREEWVNDRRGLRNRPRPDPAEGYGFVLFGDSNIVGAGLTQDDILSSVLERRCGCPVYNSGFGSWYEFLDDDYFRQHPPRFIVYESRRYSNLAQVRNYFTLPGFARKLTRHEYYGVIPERLAILADRAWKQAGIHFLRARLGSDTGWMWWQERAGARPAPAGTTVASDDEVLRAMEADIVALDASLKARGSRLIPLFLPSDSGNDVHDRRHDALIRRLQDRGIPVIGFLPSPQWPEGQPPGFWQTRDSHWSREGVALTAELLMDAAEAATRSKPRP